MDPIYVALLGVVAIAAVVGLGAAVKGVGLRAVARGMAQRLLSIRAFDAGGTGIRLLGVRQGPRADLTIVTMWVTFCFLPVVPFARRVVRFVEPVLQESRWIVVEATPLRRREIARTYLFGWVLFPLLIVGPLVLGGLISSLTRVPGRSDLPTLVRMAGTLLAAAFILVGIPWFATAIYRLLRWDRGRKMPGGL